LDITVISDGNWRLSPTALGFVKVKRLGPTTLHGAAARTGSALPSAIPYQFLKTGPKKSSPFGELKDLRVLLGGRSLALRGGFLDEFVAHLLRSLALPPVERCENPL